MVLPHRVIALSGGFPFVFAIQGAEVRLEIYWMSNGGPWGYIAARFRGRSGRPLEYRFGGFCGDLEKLERSWQTGIEVAAHPVCDRILAALLAQGLAHEVSQPPPVPRPPVVFGAEDSPI